jgi:hypothetical protein
MNALDRQVALKKKGGYKYPSAEIARELGVTQQAVSLAILGTGYAQTRIERYVCEKILGHPPTEQEYLRVYPERRQPRKRKRAVA